MERTETQVKMLTTSTLTNEPVRNRMGENIGKVEDYMLDLQRGCIEYAVLSFGGVLGIGEKLFAVPWHSFTLDTVNHNFILDVTKDQLDNAPGFDKSNWPMTEQNEIAYRGEVDRYWGRGQGMGTY